MVRQWVSAAQRRPSGATAAVGWSWCLLLAVAVQAAAAGGPGAFYPSGRYGKRVETEGPMLPAGRGGWSSGRAGRSGAPLPRADRFFMGSRYGKRGGDGPALPEQVPPLTQAQADVARQRSPQDGFVALPDMWALPDFVLDRFVENRSGGRWRAPDASTCVYTGIADYYRCSVRDEESRHEVDAQAERVGSAADAPHTAPAARPE